MAAAPPPRGQVGRPGNPRFVAGSAPAPRRYRQAWKRGALGPAPLRPGQAQGPRGARAAQQNALGRAGTTAPAPEGTAPFLLLLLCRPSRAATEGVSKCKHSAGNFVADRMNSRGRGFSLPIFPESNTSQMGSLEALVRLDPLEPAEKKHCYIDTQSVLIPTAFFDSRKSLFDFSLLSRLSDQLHKYQLQVTFPQPVPPGPQPWLWALFARSVCAGQALPSERGLLGPGGESRAWPFTSVG